MSDGNNNCSRFCDDIFLVNRDKPIHRLTLKTRKTIKNTNNY
ncbi:hypothetical protein [Rickettsia sp. wq]|nr:hypothetical protein [Rickettsia sp. wq]